MAEEQEVRARRLDKDGNWLYNLDGITPTFYNRPHLSTVQLVIVCNNERAADAVNEDLKQHKLFGKRNAVATTTLQGLTHLHRTDLSPLYGQDLVFFPSEDGGQHLYPNGLIKALDGRAKIRVVELPDRGPGGDYCHFVATGHTLGEACALIKAAL